MADEGNPIELDKQSRCHRIIQHDLRIGADVRAKDIRSDRPEHLMNDIVSFDDKRVAVCNELPFLF